VPATRLLARTYQSLVAGQAMDLALDSVPTATVGDYLRMAEGKTASLLACAAELGALLGGAGALVAAALRAFGWHLGLAFQIADDVLGIWGDHRDTGKPVGSDIRARKKSFPVVYALSLPRAVDVRAFYRRTDPAKPAEVERVTAALEALGARAFAERSAREYCRAALDSVDPARFGADQRGRLLDIARTVKAVLRPEPAGNEPG
jgi:geranylgeranyl diphosphate synthase type I